ncbi:MAG: FmdB family zinc ribbon protein [Bryobacteraceae bacterium]
MPIFEYSCDDCGTKFEKLVRRAGDRVLCPECGEAHLTPQLSTFSAKAAAPKAAPPSCFSGNCACGHNNN